MKFETDVCLKLGNMETKTETDTMTMQYQELYKLYKTETDITIKNMRYQLGQQKSLILSMQNQLQEQSKLIASLQCRLLDKKEEEKVEVDMFADWLKDDEEESDEEESDEEESDEEESDEEESDEEESEIVYTRNTGPVRIVDYNNKGSSFEVIGDTEKHYHSLIKLRCKWSMLKNRESGEKYYGWLVSDYSKKRLVENWIEELPESIERERKRAERGVERERKRVERERKRVERERKRVERERLEYIRELEIRIKRNRKIIHNL